jgi:4-amino-4-deoxy-L-arabinose transferase-like glycosyltransferase
MDEFLFKNKYNDMTIPASQYQYSIRLFRRNHTLSIQSMLLAIAAIAILLRIVSAVLQGNSVTELPGIYDQVSYDRLASRVVDGNGFSFAENHWPMTRAGEPTAHWSFLYTLYLAGIYAVFGHQPVVARLLQAVIVGGLQTYLTYLIAEKAFSKSIGLITSGIAAFYIYFIYYGGALMTEPFYITAILCSLFLAMRIAETDDRKQAIKLGLGLGIAIAITIILRQVFLLFVPFMFLWIWITRLRLRRSLPIVSTILSLGLVVLCVLPISLYNQYRFGRFVLLNTNSGYAFFWGNHPIYGTHFIPLLPSETYQTLVPAELRNLDEAALDQALLQRGVQFVFDDPKRYLLLSLSRIPAYFVFWPSSESSVLSNISRVGSFGIMLPFMLYGVFLAVRKKWTEIGNHFLNLLISPEGLLLIFVLIYSAIHLLSWALIRYRLPVDAVLIPFGAIAIWDIYKRIVPSPL